MNELSIFNEKHWLFSDVNSSLVDSLISGYEKTEAKIKWLNECLSSPDAKTAMKYYILGTSDERNRFTINVDKLIDEKSAIKELDSDYWNRAIKLTDVEDFMPQDRKNEWHEQIRENKTPKFERDTVIATIKDLLCSREKFLAEMVDGIFRALSGEHVTNRPQGFGKRMILFIGDKFGYKHDRVGYITDMRKVIAKLNGRDEPEHYGITTKVIDYAMRNTGCWVSVDGGAFKIRCYLKGTAHIEIHPDIAWQLNSILSMLYPMAIPAKFREKPKLKPKQIELTHNLLPFSVIKLLSEGKEATEIIKNGWKAEHKRIKNSRSIHSYGVDKFLLQKAHDVYEAIGGVKVGSHHQFNYDPTDALLSIISSGSLPDKRSHQFYPTPADLACDVVDMAKEGDSESFKWLEPSAGQGGIVRFMPADRTLCVEVSELHCKILESHHYNTKQCDFLEFKEGKYDRIVMNPPFSDGRWQAHLEHAASLLSSNGILFAIVPSSAFRKYTMPGHSVEYVKKVDNAFSGTSISVCILKISRCYF